MFFCHYKDELDYPTNEGTKEAADSLDFMNIKPIPFQNTVLKHQHLFLSVLLIHQQN